MAIDTISRALSGQASTAAKQAKETADSAMEQAISAVPGAVSDWLEDNVTPTTPVVDASLSISGAAADAKATGDEITDLKSAMEQLYIPSANLYNPATDRHGKTMNSSGVISDDSRYKLSDYIYIGAGNKFTIPATSVAGTLSVYFYGTNSESGFIRRQYITSNPQTFTMGAAENYIVVAMNENAPAYMLNLGDTLLPYQPYGEGEAGEFLESYVAEKTEGIDNIESKFDVINRFNKSTIATGKYLSTTTGNLNDNESFFASDYIDVHDLASIACCRTHIVCFYKSDKSFDSGQSFNTLNADGTIIRPETAYYLRFSTYNTSLDLAQIGENVTRAVYVPYGLYTMPELRVNPSQITGDEYGIIVDASGAGDYTSFTEAIYNTVDSGIDVYVKPGTYNIVSEYVALFGQEAVDGMADADTAIFNGFQYGVRLRNRKIEFAPGAHLICDRTGHTVNGTHRFSAIGVDYNAEIVGLDLDCTATFYCIHDDYGLSTPYTVKYKNCRVVGHNIYNANCIGGGCKKYSRHILENCYFDNNLIGSQGATVRYHNTNAEGAEPEIYVSNCYFNNWFTPRWYGNQTSKMKVYVNNCEARSIHKMAESANFNVDNVELFKWCNTETNPIT